MTDLEQDNAIVDSDDKNKQAATQKKHTTANPI